MKPLTLLLLSIIACSSAQTDTSVESALGDLLDGIEAGTVVLSHPIAVVIFTLISILCPSVTELGLTVADITGLVDALEPDLDTLKLLYSTPNATYTYNISTAATDITSNANFNASQQLFVYIHGFTSEANTTNYRKLSSELLYLEQHNVLALDASILLKWWYLKASTYTKFIGARLAEVLRAMVDLGLSPSNVHIVGHSLGAHISGFTGKNFTNATGETLAKITGLDPAGPCFAYLKDELKLSSTDADYVDVIHSNAGVLGISYDVGHTDYWPNGGSTQPGCTSESCNHGRSILYFIESVTSNEAFPAAECGSYARYILGGCVSNDVSYMGYISNSSSSGDYYLTTASSSPFGLGTSSTT